MEQDVVLTMRDISKNFPGVKALQNVDFTLRKGEIHAIIGENGAGKSTLLNILHGVFPATSGEIRIEGKPAKFSNIADAIDFALKFSKGLPEQNDARIDSLIELIKSYIQDYF